MKYSNIKNCISEQTIFVWSSSKKSLTSVYLSIYLYLSLTLSHFLSLSLFLSSLSLSFSLSHCFHIFLSLCFYEHLNLVFISFPLFVSMKIYILFFISFFLSVSLFLSLTLLLSLCFYEPQNQAWSRQELVLILWIFVSIARLPACPRHQAQSGRELGSIYYIWYLLLSSCLA